MPATANDSDFQRRLEHGDHAAAVEWLVSEYTIDVLSLCRNMLRDDASAEDAAQDAFQRAFTGLAGFRGDASPKSWLLAIARNGCLDRIRRLARSPWMLVRDDDDEESADDEARLASDLLDAREDLTRALAALGEGERPLIVLRFRHGLEYAELAEVFGLKPGTVRMRVSRALAKMRAALEVPTPLAAPHHLEEHDDAALEEAPFSLQRSLFRSPAMPDEHVRGDRRGAPPAAPRAAPRATPAAGPAQRLGEALRAFDAETPPALVARLRRLFA